MRYNKEMFIEKANKVHHNYYDYSKVEYINSNTKICIFCPKHGEFWQRPGSHLHGTKCPMCGYEDRKNSNLTTTGFIKKSKSIHGDKYDYSKVEYKNNKTKVCIICPIHGEFWQRPDNHTFLKQGCPICGKEKMSKKLSKSLTYNNDIFIEKARKIHGDKYDYSKVEYIDSKHRILIVCPLHGEFWQFPGNHINAGRGCPECGRLSMISSKLKSKEQFVEDANKVHDNIYDYSKFQYINNKTKSIIICPIHGEFWQTPAHHLGGCGCPKCKSSKGERTIRQFLKTNGISFNEQHRFTKCKNILPLPFDFYLPDHNTCIEYDGEQHFFPIKCWNGEKGLGEVRKRDTIKNEFCRTNNIKLVRIRYNQDPEEILSNLLD